MDGATLKTTMSFCRSLELHTRVHNQAHYLSNKLIENKKQTGYDVHGLFGIFAAGDRINNKSKRYFINYSGVKTSFLLTRACEYAQDRHTTTICEVGFCAGLSAVLFLEAVPKSRVLSFDLGDMPWTRYADDFLQRRYTQQRFPGVMYGDAATTIPHSIQFSTFHCDMVFVDGSKTFEGRLGSLISLRNVSRKNTVVFMDEVTSQECVDGSIPQRDLKKRCAKLSPGYWPSVRAYNVAVNNKWLRVVECAWPPLQKYDGICMGFFL